MPNATAANSSDNHLSAEELDQKREQATALLRKSNPEVLGISYAAGITNISLSKPISFGDNRGGIIFGKPVAEGANVYQVAFAPEQWWQGRIDCRLRHRDLEKGIRFGSRDGD